ncbi:hypothetical protein AB1L05_10370 [Cytobacillus horneckiae]
MKNLELKLIILEVEYLLAVVSSNIKVMENIALKSSNSYGIQVTVTCSNIQLTDNDVDGMTGKVLLPSEAGFDGMYLTSANGSKYKVTVSNNGQFIVSLVQ